MTVKNESPFRVLPSVNELAAASVAAGVQSFSGAPLVTAIQQLLAEQKSAISEGDRPTADQVTTRILDALISLDRPKLASVINATGILIHTNLGRAPVSRRASQAMAEAASGAVALEIEAATNQRGGRMREISHLIRVLTGAESTLVVNNNAAAVLLVLAAVATGKGVVLSRGEAVEIGGGFRVPDVMRQSGALLVEVGTTNRTYAHDYADAIDSNTAALLKVHPSNFAITGFVESASIADLSPVAQAAGISLIDDVGSGALLDTANYGLTHEATIGESIGAGADIVTASGDKLLGGPQAGIICGKQQWIDLIARHPLARAVRADKATLAGLSETLRHYTRDEAVDCLPVWRMIAATTAGLRSRAHAVIERLPEAAGAVLVETMATTGGGSLPGQQLASISIALKPGDRSMDTLARQLRLGDPGVFGRIEDDRLLLDLRSVLPEQDDALAAALVAPFS